MGENMKALAILLLVLATCARGNPIEEEGGRFHVEFPKSSGWSPVRESRPNSQSIQWTAKQEDKKRIFLFSVVNSPVKNPDAPFSEHAAEWRKSVEESADSVDSQRFMEIGGVPACELTGRITNAGSSYFFRRYMMQIRHVTYQVTVISGEKIEASDAEVAAFLASIRIKKEAHPVGTDNDGAAPRRV